MTAFRPNSAIRTAAAIGKNTAHAIQSGLVFGYVGLIEEMVRRFRIEMDAPAAIVIGTGGLAPLLASQTAVFDHIDEELTLSGLRLVHAMNRESPPTDAASEGAA